MGVDVMWVATLLTAVAALAMLVALYAATTVRDPMAKRVKALNERREQLKAGIVASTSKRRTKITHNNQRTDKLRGFLSTFKMLQESQVKDAQIKLMQAGIRSKELAIAVIFARLVLPIVIGGTAVFMMTGRVSAKSERTKTCAPATKLIGRASSHCPFAPNRSAELSALAIRAALESEIRFGVPVDPLDSIISAVSSSTLSGRPCSSGNLPFTSGGAIKTVHSPASASASAKVAPTTSLAATTLIFDAT
jgi:acid phosphatase family membrane protein YuiD